MNAKEYIRSIETRIGFNSNGFVESLNANGEEHRKSLNRKWQAYWGEELKTTYAPNKVGQYTLARNQILLNKIREAVGDASHTRAGFIHVAFLPIGNFNGFSTCAPNGDRIIVVDMLLKAILMAICHDLFALLIMGHNGRVTWDMAQHRLQHILQLIRVFRRQHVIDFDECFELTDTDDMLLFHEGNLLSECMLIFILAHEYAHHLLHLNSKPVDVALKWNGREAVLRSFATMQGQEYQADRLGFSYYKQCYQQQHVQSTFEVLSDYFFAPMLLFDLMTIDVVKGDTNIFGLTHPEPVERKLRLLAAMPSNFGNSNSQKMYEFFHNMLDLVKQFP